MLVLVLVRLGKFLRLSVRLADSAKKFTKSVALKEGRTIPHEAIGNVLAQQSYYETPAAPGTGVIAGGAVRAVLESVGVKDILTKCVGTRNPPQCGKSNNRRLKAVETALIGTVDKNG